MEPRARGASVPFDDTFLFVGGWFVNVSMPVHFTVAMYDPRSRSWRHLESRMKRARFDLAATLVHKDAFECD